MKLKILFLLFLFPLFGASQNFYETIIYDSLAVDVDYIPIRQKLDTLDLEINKLFKDCDFTMVERVLLADLFFLAGKGYHRLLSEELEKREVQEIMIRNKIDQKALVKWTSMKEPFMSREESLRIIYTMKKRLTSEKYKDFDWPKNQDRIKELAKYKLKDGEKILEIGTGNLRLSKEIARKVNNCEIYLNEIDTVALKSIYYQLDYLEEIAQIKAHRNNQFFLIRGGEKTTGIENIIFDRIIIRKAIHHFSEPEAMFNSIKKSMDKNTELIVKEIFIENCEASCCPDLLSQEKFETLMKKNGLNKTYVKEISKKKDVKYWIYKFMLPSGN